MRLPEEQESFKERVTIVSRMIFLVIVSTLLVTFIIYRFKDVKEMLDGIGSILSPIFYGIAIAYLLDPICKSVQKRLMPLLKKKAKGEKIAKGLSITIGMAIGIALIAVLIGMIVPGLMESITTIIEEMPKQVENFIHWLQQTTHGDTQAMETFSAVIAKATDAVEDWLKTDLVSTMGNVVTAVTTGVIDAVMFVFNFLVGFVVAVYVLVDKQKFLGQSKKLVYTVFKPKTADTVIDTARHGHKIFGGFLYGKILDSAIVGVITFIVLTILKTPYALLVSVIIGVTNIIPFFGPFIGAIPSAILILLAEPIQGLYFIIFIIVMQQVDGNIIGPKILGNTTGISEFWVTFALLLFGGIFGFLGMIVGVPLFAVVYYVAVLLINKQLEKKKLPTNSALYREAENIEDIRRRQQQEEEENEDLRT